ncbi:MAG: ParB/RepB/Spo0J family partition protein, partial [Clostridia bacterium]|nr:ParB/RepB/Spo0J family partition protein [Clostridia bacterium]
MAKDKGLGRGLDAIFLDNSEEDKGDKVTTLRLSEIEPEQKQPRTVFNHEPLEELASSIATHGLIQPIIVREGKNGYYKIIAGERRWRASKMAGLTEVPVIIIEADDRKAAELSLIENLQRENLNAIEEAAAYRALITEYKLTQEEVSSRIGKSRSAVANSMRLLDLPEEVAEMVKKGELSAGNARALLGLIDKSGIADLAKKVVAKGLSVRLTEELVRVMNKKAKEADKIEQKDNEFKVDYIAALEKRVTSHIGRRVK